MIIFPVVLYGCEAWSLTFKNESKLRVFESKSLRIIYVELNMKKFPENRHVFTYNLKFMPSMQQITS